MKKGRPLPVIGRSMVGGGGAAATEVATSFPRRCLGATEVCKEISRDLNEKDEERRFSESSWEFEREENFLKIQPKLAFIDTKCL